MTALALAPMAGTPARACSPPPPSIEIVWPIEGGGARPTNEGVLYRATLGGEVDIVLEGDGTLPELESVATTAGTWLRPKASFAAGASFKITIRAKDDFGGMRPMDSVAWSTGAGPDATAPTWAGPTEIRATWDGGYGSGACSTEEAYCAAHLTLPKLDEITFTRLFPADDTGKATGAALAATWSVLTTGGGCFVAELVDLAGNAAPSSQVCCVSFCAGTKPPPGGFGGMRETVTGECHPVGSAPEGGADGGAGAGGAGGTGGGGGAGGSGGADGGADGGAGAGGSGGAGGAAGQGGGGGHGGGNNADHEGGCGCAVDRRDGDASALAVAAVLATLAGALGRRRRRGRRLVISG